MYYKGSSATHAGDVELEGVYGRNMRDEDSQKKTVVGIDASGARRKDGAFRNVDQKL